MDLASYLVAFAPAVVILGLPRLSWSFAVAGILGTGYGLTILFAMRYDNAAGILMGALSAMLGIVLSAFAKFVIVFAYRAAKSWRVTT